MIDATDPGGGSNAAQIAYWNDKAAVTWTTLQQDIDTVLAPLTAVALDAAAPASGERVIDVGCGCGATMLELARRVGPTGRVLGLDVSKPMSSRARERIAAAQLGNADVIVHDAATYVFSCNDADLLFSRFGVMFFADPAAGFANLRLAMRPGGRLVCMAWRPLAENPWFNVPLEAGRPLLPPQPPPEPHAPGPFAFADADRVRGILAAAGWRDVNIVRHDSPMRLAGGGQRDQAAEFATRVGPLARILAEADPDVRSRVRQAVRKVLDAYDGPDGISLAGSIWLIAAQA